MDNPEDIDGLTEDQIKMWEILKSDPKIDVDIAILELIDEIRDRLKQCK